MYEDILLPTDGSDAVERAVEEALHLAELAGGRLHVLYVVDTSAAGGVPEAEAMALREMLEQSGREAIAAVETAAADRDVPVSTVLRGGSAHREIVAYADEADVDLIVMSTHGRAGLDRLLLGSVTERVIRQATRPVLVTREG